VTEEAGRAGQEPPVRWLTAGELESWLSLALAADRIMSRIDTSGIN
jgi:hypothetical protein